MSDADCHPKVRVERYHPEDAAVERTIWKVGHDPGLARRALLFGWGGPKPSPARDDPGDTGMTERRLLRARREADARIAVLSRRCRAERDDPDDEDSWFSAAPTALYDRKRRQSDPLRHVETTAHPYLILPLRGLFGGLGVRLGDFATVLCPRTGRMSHAIVGDSREVPEPETSIYLAERLELAPREDSVACVLFPGSGPGQGRIPSVEAIRRVGSRFFRRGPDPSNPRPLYWGPLLADCLGDPRLAGPFLEVAESGYHAMSRV